MTNLFAALGWTLCLVLLDPDVRARGRGRRSSRSRLPRPLRARSGPDRAAVDHAAFGAEAVRARRRHHDATALEPGVLLATMLPLTNTTALAGLADFDPDRWDGRRLRDADALDAKEVVTTFGHGAHRCPAQRFSLSAIGRAVERLVRDLRAAARASTSVRAIPSQIGGVARAADPCPVDYVRRPPLPCAQSLYRGVVDGRRDRVRDAVATRPRRARRRARRLGAENVGADATVTDVASPGNGMSSETVLFEVTARRRDSSATRPASRRCPSSIPSSRSTTSSCSAGAWTSCAPTPTCPRPRSSWQRARPEVAGHAVPRDAPHRRRGAARHPAVRVRRLDDGRDARSSARTLQDTLGRACSRGCTRSRPPTHDLAFLAQPEHGASRARPAARLPALVLRVGARRRRRTR